MSEIIYHDLRRSAGMVPSLSAQVAREIAAVDLLLRRSVILTAESQYKKVIKLLILYAFFGGY